jgi:hypothetical protein
MTPDYLTEKVGTFNDDTLIGSNLEVLYGLAGNDTLRAASTATEVVLVGGSGSDRYEANNDLIYVLENGNSNNDVLVADAIDVNSEDSYVLEIDSRHILAGNIAEEQFFLIVDWQEPENRIEKIILNGTEYLYSDLANSFREFENYLGNYSIDEVEELSDGLLDFPDSIDGDLDNIVQRARELENENPSDGLRLEEFLQDPARYIGAIRDFDGNNLGSPEGWKSIGSVDIQGDGDLEYVFVNPIIGRWASVGADSDSIVDFDHHGRGGDTRVVGIYIDPLVESGEVVRGSAFDSQRRFQNDLYIDNLTLLDGDDYDGDGLQETYFRVNDGTAVLHAYMHADGNIRYANYQSEADLEEFMTANDVNNSVWGDWFN